MNIQRLRADFDAQVRQNTTVLRPGVAEIFAGHGVICELAVPGQGLSQVTWSQLDERTADDAISAQVDFFRRRGEPFEWQLLGYDEPADLGERLVKAGFVPDEEEVLLFAETERIARDLAPPDGIRLIEAHDAADVEAAADTMAEMVPGSTRRSRHVRRQLAALSAPGEPMAVVVAMAGDEPVSSATVSFGPGREFAGLNSAATRPGWRGRGIYRAIVAYRARL